MSGPLEGIRILDLSWVLAGPFCTMNLSDLGAEVIKLERPNVGDLARGNAPFINGESSYFMSINRGKKSITIDLQAERGKEIFLKLVSKVDVIVENFVPGTMKRLGLDYDMVKKHNPRIIYASISGFGQSGPHAQNRALDVIIQAAGGLMSITDENRFGLVEQLIHGGAPGPRDRLIGSDHNPFYPGGIVQRFQSHRQLGD